MENLKEKSNQELLHVIRYTDMKEEAWAQLRQQNPTNEDLRYVIEYTDMKHEAWAQLLDQGATNEDLRYLIRYTSMKEEAWIQLLKQNPSNKELLYLIRYTSMKKEAWVQLLKQNPTNRNLRLVTPQEEMKPRDWVELVNAIGLSTNEEKKLITEIAKIVVEDNSRLDMSRWHCGTAHCLAGWACVLNETAAKIEAEFSTEIAGTFALPSYAYLFYLDDKEVLKVLRKVLKNN